MTVPAGLPAHLTLIWEEMARATRSSISCAELELLVGQVWRQRDARQRVDDEGEIVADAKGNPTPHPALAVERDAGKVILGIMAKYGRPSK